MKKGILHIEMHYLPCIQYFVYLNSFEKIIVDINDVYIKQTYRNRCRISAANKVEDLIIPVKKGHNRKMLSSDIFIDYQQKWMNNHLRAIKSAYGKAPFFAYYVDELFAVYNKKPVRLFELNRNLLTKCLEILEMDINIEYSEHYTISDLEGHFDARNEINPKKNSEKNHLFSPVEYFQVFGNNFARNLSIVDLIFCEGPHAKPILDKSSALE
jgi:hypothetical protein